MLSHGPSPNHTCQPTLSWVAGRLGVKGEDGGVESAEGGIAGCRRHGWLDVRKGVVHCGKREGWHAPSTLEDESGIGMDRREEERPDDVRMAKSQSML
jgi:hypothetical protein